MGEEVTEAQMEPAKEKCDRDPLALAVHCSPTSHIQEIEEEIADQDGVVSGKLYYCIRIAIYVYCVYAVSQMTIRMQA